MNGSEDGFRAFLLGQLGGGQGLDSTAISSWAEFEDALDRLHHRFENDEITKIVAIDEYEALGERIAGGRFDVQVLGSLRASMQGHRRIIWLLAGKRTFDELPEVAWARHLIGVRSLSVGMFTSDESTGLLADPMRHAPNLDENRTLLADDTWGPGGAAAIHDEAGGWPYFVQLLAESTLYTLTRDGAAQLDRDSHERMLDLALERGEQPLHELILGESTEAERRWLSQLMSSDGAMPPDDPLVRRALRRRMLVDDTDGDRWTLRVPLMRRWLRRYA